MTQTPITKQSLAARQRQRGFNLVELMIGITISLFGLAAVSAMMMSFSSKRASITSTLSAQDSGVMALFRLERDIAQAGYGLMHLQRCASLNDGTASFAPYPVLISDGGANSDIIEVQYANARSGSPGTSLWANTSDGNTLTTSQYSVLSASGFDVGDLVVSSSTAPAACVVTPITQTRKCTTTDTASPRTFSCVTTTANSTTAPSKTAVTVSATDSITNVKSNPLLFEWLGHATSGISASTTAGYLANWGQRGEFVRRQFDISGNTLQVREYLETDAEGLSTANTLVNDIVFMKAQYGMTDTTWSGTACTRNSSTVTVWVDGTQTITAQNSCGVIAVRVGLVARSALRENEAVELAGGVTSMVVLPTVNDSGGNELSAAVLYDPGTNATRYRHRVYYTIVPLKNVIWAN